MKIDGSFGSLLQGVSQQPPRDRLDGQCTLQENMSANPVHGLMRRPPTDMVGSLGTATEVKGWHNFQTRDGKKFLAMFKNGSASVFDLNAVAQPLTIDSDAVAYLAWPGKIRCNTDDRDRTTVLNTSMKAAMVPGSFVFYDNSVNTAAIFQVLGGAHGMKYSILIDGVERSWYKPPSGSEADARYAETSVIADNLLNGLFANTGITPIGSTLTGQKFGSGYCAGWGAGISGDIFWIKAPTTTAFTVSVADGAGGINFKACTNTVTKIADLPRLAPHYYAVRIAEHSDKEKDAWFKFVVSGLEFLTSPSPGSFGKAGYWQECVAPNVTTQFDNSTMPHEITYNSATGVFRLSRSAYEPRGVGTTVSSPDPSFIGNTINDVSSFQGRTVLLSGSNVIMSRTNKFTHYWRGSVTALADTDPIDVNSTVDNSPMVAAVQFNKDLVMFTRKGQHVIFGRSALSPANAALVMTTRFESEPQAHPVAAGRNVFFAANFGRFTGVREFYTQNTAEINDSRPITMHVNEYLLGKATHMSVSANYETLLVHTEAQQTAAYIYQYIWADEKKVQSAWHTWSFSKNIVYSFFDEHILYLVQQIGTSYYLLRLRLDVQDSDGVGYPVYLDQRFDVPGCNTQFVLPFSYMATEPLVCVQGTGCPTPGLTASIKSIDNVPGTGYVVTLKKDMKGGSLVVGTRYKSRYIPTMQRVKDQNGVVIGTAKQVAKHFIVSLSETGYIAGCTRSKYGDGPEVAFNARIIGDVDNIVGEQPLSDEKFVLPFRQDVTKAEIEFYSDSHLPMTLIDIEYVGQYIKRGRRIANQHGG